MHALVTVSTEWQSVLDSTIKRLLTDVEKTLLELCTSSGQSFVQRLHGHGIDPTRLFAMLNTANRSAITAIKTFFLKISLVAVNGQRELSRELLPTVSEKMKKAYDSVKRVHQGPGTFIRMKEAMASKSQHAVQSMFDKAMKKLLQGIYSLVKELKTMIESTAGVIRKVFDNVFRVFWDEWQSQALVIPEMQQKIRACRDALLPELNELVKLQGSACDDLGIERAEVDLDVIGVKTFEHTLTQKKAEAVKNGDMFDLCNSDAELSIQPKRGVKVKAERKGTLKSSSQPGIDVIDLCDSESGDEWTKPAAELVSSRPNMSIKEETLSSGII